MATFDVYAVKACPFRKGCAVDQRFANTVEIIVRHDPVCGNGSVLLENGVIVGNQGSRRAVGFGISAGMGCLHDHHRCIAVFPQRCFLNGFHLPLEMIQIVFCDIQLPGVGSALLHNSGGLKPDQSCTAFGKPFIAALCEQIGASVSSAVAALHSLTGKAVRYRLAAHRKRRSKHRHIRGKGKHCAKLPVLRMKFL